LTSVLLLIGAFDLCPTSHWRRLALNKCSANWAPAGRPAFRIIPIPIPNTETVINVATIYKISAIIPPAYISSTVKHGPYWGEGEGTVTN
jgi:hypothetical protein